MLLIYKNGFINSRHISSVIINPYSRVVIELKSGRGHTVDLFEEEDVNKHFSDILNSLVSNSNLYAYGVSLLIG